jgi:hypothetical protein
MASSLAMFVTVPNAALQPQLPLYQFLAAVGLETQPPTPSSPRQKASHY